MKRFRTLLRNVRGATAIEYGLIAGLISVAAVVAMGTLGNSIGDSLNNTTNKMK